MNYNSQIFDNNDCWNKITIHRTSWSSLKNRSSKNHTIGKKPEMMTNIYAKTAHFIYAVKKHVSSVTVFTSHSSFQRRHCHWLAAPFSWTRNCIPRSTPLLGGGHNPIIRKMDYHRVWDNWNSAPKDGWSSRYFVTSAKDNDWNEHFTSNPDWRNK